MVRGHLLQDALAQDRGLAVQVLEEHGLIISSKALTRWKVNHEWERKVNKREQWHTAIHLWHIGYSMIFILLRRTLVEFLRLVHVRFTPGSNRRSRAGTSPG